MPLRICLPWLKIGACICGMLTIALSGCGNNTNGTMVSGPKNCMKVGILLPESSTSSHWEGKDHPALNAALSSALPGVSIDFENANGDSDTQVNQAQSALANGACILVVAPVDSAKASVIVQAAKSKSVPVIAYDRIIKDPDLGYYVSYDNVKIGQLQGQYIADHYKQYVTAGHNNIVFINGSQDDNNAVLFKNGVHQVLDPLIQAQTLTSKYETFTQGWVNATAQMEMESALSQNGNDIQIAYVANDGMANSAITALQKQNLQGKVLVTGLDATVQGFQNILLGYQSMTIYKPIVKAANSTAQLIAALSKGTDTSSITTSQTDNGSVKVPSILAAPVMVDKTNIASTVIADNYVTKADICQGLPKGVDTGGLCS
jgi:D-xylose transport system substrate-binding protein